MARKYYHAIGAIVLKDNHDGISQGTKIIAECPTRELAVKTALKLTRCDDYEYALSVLAEHGNKYAMEVLAKVRDNEAKTWAT